MPEPPSADDLRNQLKRRGVHLNTLHAALRIPYLDPRVRRYRKDREQRLVKLVAMLGGIRLPDLAPILELSQPTIWRIVEGLRASGALRVVAGYNDHVAGRRAKWVQPKGSADLSDARRAALIETVELIRAYLPLWQMEQARAVALRQASQQQLPAPPVPVIPQPKPQASPLPAPRQPVIAEVPAPAAPVPRPAPIIPPAPQIAAPIEAPPVREYTPLQTVALDYDPVFERPPSHSAPEAFPWAFAFKMGMGTLAVSMLITIVLLLGT